jgi:hypothetical protein
MKMIASRELAARPAGVWELLEKEGAVVVTRNGQPEGIFVSTSGESWFEDIQEGVFARARRALGTARTTAAQTGTARLSEEEIEAEIMAVRAERNRKTKSE